MRDCILIVDASVSIQAQEKALLLQRYFQTVSVDHPDQAMEWIRSGRRPVSECILFDINCGQREICEAIAPLKREGFIIPAVVMVDYGDDATGMQLVSHGAHDYLVKPAPESRLRLTLEHALTFGRLLRQSTPDSPALLNGSGQARSLRDLEEEAIRLALRQAGGCMSRAARSLGIGRSTLYRKIGEYAPGGQISRENQTTRPMIQIASGGHS